MKPRPLVPIFAFFLPLCFSLNVPIDEANQGNKARVAYALTKEVSVIVCEKSLII